MTSNDARSGRPVPPDGFTAPQNMPEPRRLEGAAAAAPPTGSAPAASPATVSSGPELPAHSSPATGLAPAEPPTPQTPVLQNPAPQNSAPQTSAPQDAAAPPTRPFDRKDWLVVALAVLEAVLWVEVFDFDLGFQFGLVMPGLGMTLFTLVGFGCLFAVLGRRARIDRTTVPLLVATFLLALVPALFGNQYLRVLNVFVLWVTGTFTAFMVADLWRGPWARLGAFLAAAAHFVKSQFAHATKPFKALGAARGQGMGTAASRNVGGVLAGVALAAVLLIVVIPLLMSADEVFNSLVANWRFDFSLEDEAWRVFYGIIVAPVLFGLLWGFSRETARSVGNRASSAMRPQRAALASAAVVLVSLDIVYLVFCGVQFVYLFGGTQTAFMQGGYAEYARSGFFQLVAVAAINLAAGLAAAKVAGDAVAQASEAGQASLHQGRWKTVFVRVLNLVLLGCTAVILASAAWRMGLYIAAYGLSVLRMLTLLGMVFILVCLVACTVKTLAARFNFFRVFFVSGVALWIAFNFLNVDLTLANYNVDRYIAGDLEQMDTTYLIETSPDALPALERLLDHVRTAGDGQVNAQALEESIALERALADDCPWQYSSLSYWVN